MRQVCWQAALQDASEKLPPLCEDIHGAFGLSAHLTPWLVMLGAITIPLVKTSKSTGVTQARRKLAAEVTLQVRARLMQLHQACAAAPRLCTLHFAPGHEQATVLPALPLTWDSRADNICS